MIHFYGNPSQSVYAVQTQAPIAPEDDLKLQWLFADAPKLKADSLSGFFTGHRATTITPWSTNAVEITQNMEVKGILRIEEFHACTAEADFDKMLLQKFDGLDQSQFDVHVKPEEVQEIDDIAAYNMQEGLSLNDNEIDYLIALSETEN
jgi:phosphoribosylformylglycinamidine synthase